jgi:hypothetical protein
MTDGETKSRKAMTAADRLAAREHTNTVARQALDEERRRREEKTKRLRKARLELERQAHKP